MPTWIFFANYYQYEKTIFITCINKCCAWCNIFTVYNPVYINYNTNCICISIIFS